MLETVALAGIVMAGVLAYVLYRQRQVTASLQKSLQIAEQSLITLRQTMATSETALEAKSVDIGKQDALILRLRQTIAEQEGASSELAAKLTGYETQLATLHEQSEISKTSSVESKALFATLANVAYDLVFVLNEDHIVIALNKSADKFFGQKHPIGERIMDVIDAPELQDIIERTGDEEDLEEQILLDNTYYRVRTQFMRYEQHCFVGVALQDVTQLVKLNRARRDMVANISHELRHPISNIRLAIDSLFYDQNRPKRKASIATLRAIARETDTLQWIVQELLDLSMIESGQAIMRLVPVRLVDVVADSVERVRDQLETQGLKVVQHVPDKLVVLCDYEQTRRVMINLIHNAIKWSPPNDAITVSASGNHEEVTIRIFDNGPGVPEDQRERIFERFYQIDTSRSSKDGTGLGLAICRHIVEAQGGTIWAEGNSAGRGGRFLFTLLDGGTETPIEAPIGAGQHDSGLNSLIAARYPNEVTNGANGMHSPHPINPNRGDEGEIEFED
jgi:signal transduction histidine kinase